VSVIPTCYSEGTSLSCFPEKTIITTKYGYKNIEDIQENDLVLTHTGQFKQVNQIMSRSANKLVELKLCSFMGKEENIKLTLEHPVYAIINTPKKQSGWCKSPNNVIVKNNTKYFWDNAKPQWIEADKLNKGDIVLFPKIQFNETNIQNIDLVDEINDENVLYDDNQIWNKYSNHNKMFNVDEIANKYNVCQSTVYALLEPSGQYKFKKDSYIQLKQYLKENNVCFAKKIPRKLKVTPELFRLFGYFISEGNTSKTNINIQFSFHNNETIYQNDVLYLMKKYFNLNGKITHSKISKCTKVMFYSSVVSNLFKKWFGVGAHNKQIPQFCFNYSKEYIIELLKGLYYGDGHYSNILNRISYCTASLLLKEQIFILLTKLDIFPTIYKRNHNKNKNTYSIIVCGKKAEELSKCFGIYQENAERKRQSHNQYWSDDKYFYLVIADKTNIDYDGLVYNFEVEDDNSYVAQHVIVHNCLESIASKIMPITTWVGGLSDIVQPNFNGLVIQPNNIDALVEAIEYCINNPKHVQEMRENGQHMIKYFDKKYWDDDISKIVKKIYGEP
jgi:intein/homing endonuclease